MTLLMESLLRALGIGVGATLVMDAWLLVLKLAGVPTFNFGLLGRWVGHMPNGQWAHDGIAKSPAIKHEVLLGWLTHYGTGLVYAMLLLCFMGLGWARQPTLLPALLVGVGTVVAPLFVMQPAMGAGLASSKTPTPLRNCIKSVANHTAFGLGLYIAALATANLF